MPQPYEPPIIPPDVCTHADGTSSSLVPLFLDPEAAEDLNNLADGVSCAALVLLILAKNERLDSQTRAQFRAYAAVTGAIGKRLEAVNHRNGMCKEWYHESDESE